MRQGGDLTPVGRRGQDVDLSFLKRVEGLVTEDGVVKVDERMMTGCPGVLAGGDMVPPEHAVSVAVGHGKKAARNIDAYLRGEVYGRGAGLDEPSALFEAKRSLLWQLQRMRQLLSDLSRRGDSETWSRQTL